MEKIWHEKDLSISRPADTELCWYSVAAVVEPDPCKFIGNGAYPLLQTQALYASIESLRAECKIGSMQATISANILRSREKGLRLPSDQSRRLAFSESATSRLKSKPGAHLKAKLLSPHSLIAPASPSISMSCARGTEACPTALSPPPSLKFLTARIPSSTFRPPRCAKPVSWTLSINKNKHLHERVGQRWHH